jgi:tetratricopeptide (TPR) repeat protein
MTAEPQPLISDEDATVREVAGLARTGDLHAACALANAELAAGRYHPVFFNVRANWHWRKGFYRRALADFQRTLDYLPDDAGVLNAIGRCCAKLELWREALAAFDCALSAAPEFVAAHHGRGVMLQLLGDVAGAEASLRRAESLDSGYADAIGSLALLCAQAARWDDARHFASRAIALDAGNAAALTASAAVHLADGSIAAASKTVQFILEQNRFGAEMPTDLAIGLLADAFEADGDPHFAFGIRSLLRRKRYETHLPRFAAERRSIHVARLTAWFGRTEPWKVPPAAAGASDSPPRAHVFLLGYVRTGTTLLESVLAAHPGISVLDERECFPEEAKSLMRSDAGLDRLAALAPNDAEQFRHAYWQNAQEQGAVLTGKTFVDKMPFASLRLPLIARLFPDARIIFAVRDPRDVVLSCFRHGLVLDATTFEFLLLEDCARFYAAVMQLAACYRDKLPLRIHDHRYEDMVLDFDGCTRRACDFLGIEWDARMREFPAAADNVVDRALLSRPQVQQKLYGDAVGRWRRYARELEPVLPILQPWVDHFGYPAQ